MKLFPRRHRPSGSRRAGSGEPVLLIHPFMLSHHSWRPVIEQLSVDHDVLAVSMPGHYGGPPLSWRNARFGHLVDHVEAEMNRVGWDTAHVVGNSLGGWAALEMGVRGRARSVTAIAPAGGYEGFSPRDAVMGMAFLGVALGRTGLQVTNLIPGLPFRALAMRTLAHDTSLLDPADIRHISWTALGATHPLQILLACVRDVPPKRLPEIDVPVHLVFADQDVVIPPARHAPYFIERLPGAEVTFLDDVGHCPQIENPRLVADLVRAAIARGALTAPATSA